jgi:polyisoprenoid-binding protein YceI
MKRSFIALALALVLAGSAFSQSTWSFDKAHSKVGFSIGYMLITDVEGYFKKFEGTVTSPKEDFINASVDFTIDARTVDTDEPDRDKHLNSEDFFYTAKYPSFTFKSTSVKKVKGNNYQVKGNLTMRGETKQVTLNGTFGGVKKDPWNNTKAGFKLTGTVNRKDYGISYNKALDAGGFILSDEVTINLNIILVKK